MPQVFGPFSPNVEKGIGGGAGNDAHAATPSFVDTLQAGSDAGEFMREWLGLFPGNNRPAPGSYPHVFQLLDDRCHQRLVFQHSC